MPRRDAGRTVMGVFRKSSSGAMRIEPVDRKNRNEMSVRPGDDGQARSGDLLAPTAVQSTEVYWPYLRLFAPGPAMNSTRTSHRSVKLPDGRVLISGGITSSGIATSTCDIYDPETNTITATGAMNVARAGHGLTVLQNGLVLATGGIPDYTNANTNFVALMNGAHDSAELYDLRKDPNGLTDILNTPAGQKLEPTFRTKLEQILK